MILSFLPYPITITQWQSSKNSLEKINEELESRLAASRDLEFHLDELRTQFKELEVINSQQEVQIQELANENGGMIGHERSTSSVPASLSKTLGSEIARMHQIDRLSKTSNEGQSEDGTEEGDTSTGSVYQVTYTKKRNGKVGFLPWL